MTEARFIELLAAYGAELSRWPAEERMQAEEFLAAGSHRLKDIWDSERVFDRLLGVERDIPASVQTEFAILAVAPDRRAVLPGIDLSVRHWRRPQWMAGGAIAASLALGFAVGYAAEPQQGSDFTQMLSLTGAGAGAVFLSAMNEGEN